MSDMEILTVCIALLSLAIAAHAEWRVSKIDRFESVRWEAHLVARYADWVTYKIEHVGRKKVAFAAADIGRLAHVKVVDNPGRKNVKPGDMLTFAVSPDSVSDLTVSIPVLWRDGFGVLRRGSARVRSTGTEARHE